MRAVRVVEVVMSGGLAIAASFMSMEMAIASEVGAAEQHRILLADIQAAQSAVAAGQRYLRIDGNTLGYESRRSAPLQRIALEPHANDASGLLALAGTPNQSSSFAPAPQARLADTAPRIDAANPASQSEVPAAAQFASAHSLADLLLAALIGLGLVAYQLCRKHRLLRPHPFSI